MDYSEHGKELQDYKDYRPTQFDSRGLAGERMGIGGFKVLPVIQTRDSRPLERSNFESALEIMGGESEDVQVHRFGHWGPGWFEIILVKPEKELLERAGEIVCALENYSILDEAHYSDLAFDEASEYWGSIGMRERIEICKRFDVSIFASRRDEIPEDYSGSLFSYLAGE